MMSVVQLSHPYMTTGKTIALTIFVRKVMSQLFYTLYRLVIAFLPRSKCLLISWLQSPSAVIFQPKKIKCVTVSTFSPSICHEVIGMDAMTLGFWMLSFKPAFSPSSRGSLVPLHFLPFRVIIICTSEVVDISPSNLDSKLWFIKPSIFHDVLCI